MKTKVSEYDFVDAFRAYDRMAGWSVDGLRALHAYFEELEEDCGMEIELDVVAICCEWTEEPSAVEWLNENGYALDYSDCIDDDDEREEHALNYLRDNTQVIVFDGGVIAMGF